jgi:hypothetical protein
MGFIIGTSRTFIYNRSRGAYFNALSATGGTAEFILRASKLLKSLVVFSPNAIVLSVGTTVGGTELVDNYAIPANTPTVIDIGYEGSASANTTIYFTGTEAGTEIDIYNF